MAGAYDADMAGSAPGSHEAERNSVYVVVQVTSPQGDKHPLKIRPADDVSTLRALVTQMFDTQDWTTVADKREDRQEYSDILDEDTGFSEVISLQSNPESKTQGFMERFSGRPRTWLEWADKKGKLRLMCGAYTLEDGKTLEFYHIKEGSVIHPLYERYGDTLDASAAMLTDPTWYKQQLDQAKSLANELSAWEWPSRAPPVFSAPTWAASAPSWSGFSAGSATWSNSWSAFGRSPEGVGGHGDVKKGPNDDL